MNKKLAFYVCLAAFVCGCESSSSGSSVPEPEEDLCGGCPENEWCDEGTCRKDAIDSACEPACTNDQVCNNGKCESGGSGELNVKCTPECGVNYVCENGKCVGDKENHACATCASDETCYGGACVKLETACAQCGKDAVCIGGVCYSENTTQSQCLKCSPNQVCRGNTCYDATDFCATCSMDEKCVDGKNCVKLDDPCAACSAEQACVDGVCVACPYAMCNGVCCEDGYDCDRYTGKCEFVLYDQPACNGLYCNEDEVCSTEGQCEYDCGDAGTPCDYTCCGDGSYCNIDHCSPVCDTNASLCGVPGSEVCCSNDMVCENGKCLAPCDGTRCGASLEYCCDTSDEICAFNKCITPTSELTCAVNDDCDLWSFCETASHRCISQDEDTNACIWRPEIAAFSPKKQWDKNLGVILCPIIALNLTDDNGDGKIDDKDIPDIVGVGRGTTSGSIFVLSGDDGHVIVNQPKTKETNVMNRFNLGAAKVDKDEYPEIVIGGADTDYRDGKHDFIRIFNVVPDEKSETGYSLVLKANVPTVLAPSPERRDIETHASFVDVDDDGHVEIVTTSGVISDAFEYKCKFDATTLPLSTGYYVDDIIVADLDQDGKSEIIGNKLVSHDCKLLADAPTGGDRAAHVAVGDLLPDNGEEGELVPEIVRTTHNGKVDIVKVYKTITKDANGNDVVTWTQKVAKSTSIPVSPTRCTQNCNTVSGPPVLADFDGDKKIDIGIASKYSYVVFRNDLTTLWEDLSTQDYSSARTGSSVFDFNGDGISEVVYRDETMLRIYSGPGKDGKAEVVFSTPSSSATVSEYPLILDVDNDGQTELVFADTAGFHVYEDPNGNWVRTRKIWNQFSYHVTNINEDGTVPRHEQANWLNKRLNNYRANTQPEDGFNAPNLVAGTLSASLDKCPTHTTLTATLSNKGSIGVQPGVYVSFYINEEARQLYLGTVKTTEPIAPGMTVSVVFDWDHTATVVGSGSDEKINYASNASITFVINDNPDPEALSTLHECVDTDNAGSGVTEACPIL